MDSVRSQVSVEEWQMRVDLAACYRLVALYGWADLVFTHISARIPGPEHHFLINPYGLMFDEITASSLVKVDQQCNKLIDSPYPVNPAGFVIHSAVHEARDDIQCVLHTHTRAGVAVSAQKAGVLPISQQSTFVVASLAYHDYEGVAFRDEEKPRLQADLGHKTYLMLRNHGLLTVGRTVADAFLNMRLATSLLCALAGAAMAVANPLHFDNWVYYTKNFDGSAQWEYDPRLLVPFDFANGWTFTQRVDVPFYYTDKVGSANPQGAWSFGLSDAYIEEIFDTPDLAHNFRPRFSVRLVAPTGGEAPFGQDQWQVAPGAGFAC